MHKYLLERRCSKTDTRTYFQAFSLAQIFIHLQACLAYRNTHTLPGASRVCPNTQLAYSFAGYTVRYPGVEFPFSSPNLLCEVMYLVFSITNTV